MDNQHGMAQGNLLMLCGSLGGRGVWGRMDIRKYATESLHYSPETITALFIGYISIQNKHSNKKNPTPRQLQIGTCHGRLPSISMKIKL